MNAKCIYSKTIEELIKSPQHFEDGTIAIIDDNKCYVYNNGWNPISNVQMENKGISIDLYSLNKNIMNQMKPINEQEINELKNSVNALSEYGMYFMLLCKDYNYYTIFHKNFPSIISTDSFANMVIILCQELGDIIGWENTDQGAIEVWIKINDEAYCFYLFQYDAGIVECN